MDYTEKLIGQLKKSDLYAECRCGGEFKLSDAFLFDGSKTFPAEAKEIQELLKAGLVQEKEDLKKKVKLTTEKAEITARSVNLGQKLEKVFPTMKNFKWKLPDCRPMGDPIDLLVFNGYSISSVDSLSFVEIKTGGARLNKHQKAIKDAIEDKKVSYKVFK